MKESGIAFLNFREFIMPMKRYTVIALILLLLLVQVWSSAAQESITPGTPVEGKYAGEPVAYTIEASRGQLVIASMESDDLDSYLTLTEDGEELATDDDSGTDYNALLTFVAQADGPVTIEASTLFSSGETGAFTLSVDVLDPVAAALDEPATLEPESAESTHVYAVFEGTAGTVVNLSAVSSSDDDIALNLIGVNAAEIDGDDDDGPANNPLLRRVVLPDDGLYLVRIGQAFSEEPLTGAVELLVETTEPLYLSDTPQPLVLGDGEGQIGTEVYTIDVEAGKTYRFIFTIEPLPDDEGGVDLELLDTDRFFNPSLDAQHTTRITWDYVSNSSGTIRLDVHPTLFANDLTSIEYTAALEVVEGE
jgi:hypothetical protein